VALVVGYSVAFVRGVAGFRVHAGHFAERRGLVVIIALGESIVAAGAGVSGARARDGPCLSAAQRWQRERCQAGTWRANWTEKPLSGVSRGYVAGASEPFGQFQKVNFLKLARKVSKTTHLVMHRSLGCC
jgi:Bacterial low temperature requirement A protein (LtrA)